MTVSAELVAEIRHLFHNERWKPYAIAKQLHVHRDVVKRIVGMPRNDRKTRAPRALLKPYRQFLTETLERYPTVVATRLYDMLVERGFRGSPRAVRRYVKPLRPTRIKEAFVQVETVPGEQAQVDWAHVGSIHVPGGERPLWAFVMVLSHSRAIWAELVLEQTATSVRRSLLRSTSYFGGCTRQWLFDNPKTIVLERCGNVARFHPVLLQTTSELNVEPRLCGVRRPQQKGKVERAIRYLKDRFFSARKVHSIAEGNEALLEWIETIANKRQHPIHPEKTVAECLQAERQVLLSTPAIMPDEAHVIPIAIDARARLQFDTNVYSAPARYAATTQQLVVYQEKIALMVGSAVVAEHVRCWGRRQLIENPVHIERTLARKSGAHEPTERAQLVRQIPAIAELFQLWLRHGEPLQKRVKQCAMLVQAHGVQIVAESVAQMLAQHIQDIGALNKLCEKQRRLRPQKPTPQVRIAAHVQDGLVVPHALESYDE